MVRRAARWWYWLVLKWVSSQRNAAKFPQRPFARRTENMRFRRTSRAYLPRAVPLGTGGFGPCPWVPERDRGVSGPPTLEVKRAQESKSIGTTYLIGGFSRSWDQQFLGGWRFRGENPREKSVGRTILSNSTAHNTVYFHIYNKTKRRLLSLAGRGQESARRLLAQLCALARSNFPPRNGFRSVPIVFPPWAFLFRDRAGRNVGTAQIVARPTRRSRSTEAHGRTYATWYHLRPPPRLTVWVGPEPVVGPKTV